MDISAKEQLLEAVNKAVEVMNKVLANKKIKRLNDEFKTSLETLVANADEARGIINNSNLENDKELEVVNQIVGKYEEAEEKCNKIIEDNFYKFVTIDDMLADFEDALSRLEAVKNHERFSYLKDKEQDEVLDLVSEDANLKKEVIQDTDLNDRDSIDNSLAIIRDYEEAADKFEKKLSSRKVVKKVEKENQTPEEKAKVAKARKRAAKILGAGLSLALVIALLALLLKGCGKDKDKPVLPDDPTPTQSEQTLDDEDLDYLKGIANFDIDSYDLTDYTQRRNAAKIIWDNLSAATQDEISLKDVQAALVVASLDKLPEDKQATFFTTPEHLARATYNAGRLITDPNVNSNDVIQKNDLALTDAELQRVLDYATNGTLTLDDFKACKTDKGYNYGLVLELCAGKMTSKDRAAAWTKVFIELDVESTLEFTLPSNALETDYSYFYTTTGIMNNVKDDIVNNLNDEEMTAIYGSNEATLICPTEVIRQQNITNWDGTYSTPGEIDMYVDENGFEWPKSYVKTDENGNTYVDVVIAVDENKVPTSTVRRNVVYSRTVLSNQFLDANSDYVGILVNPENSGFTR